MEMAPQTPDDALNLPEPHINGYVSIAKTFDFEFDQHVPSIQTLIMDVELAIKLPKSSQKKVVFPLLQDKIR